MATLISDLADYIAAQASLTIDTNFFIGMEVPDVSGVSTLLHEIPGSAENYSGFEQVMFQLRCTGDSYVDVTAQINTLYEIINHKPGFADADLITHNVKYCEPQGMPYPIGRDDQAGYVWAVNFLIKKE